jgi:probable O-glycosylation ligase (exosortase A-associated)
MSLRDLSLFGVVFGALPFILRRPYIGILLWCVFSYMNPHRYTWGLAYDFPFAAVIAGTTLTGLMFSRESRRIPWNGLTYTWVVFILWMCFTTLFALVPVDAVNEWDRSMKIQLMTFVTLMLVNSRERLNALVWTIVISLGFFGIKGGIFTFISHGEDMVFGPPDSFIAGNNSLALALVMIFPLMRYLQLNTESRLLRFGLAGTMALSTLAVLASYSRGAFVAIAAMGVFLFLKSRKKAMVFLAALILIPTVFAFMPEKWYERIETIEAYNQDASFLGRVNAWWFAYNLAKDRPIVGGGFATFDKELFKRYAPEPDNFHDSHSIYFEVLGEHGFVGLALFLALWVLAFRRAGRATQLARDRPEFFWARDLGAMVQVSMIGFAVGGAFLGLAYFDLYYHLIALGLLASTLVEKEVEKRALPDAALDAAIPVAGQQSG